MGIWSIGLRLYDTDDEAQLIDLLAQLADGVTLPLTHKGAGFAIYATPASYLTARRANLCRTSLTGTFRMGSGQTADGEQCHGVELNTLAFETKAYIAAEEVPYELIALARYLILKQQIHELLSQAEEALKDA